MNKSERCLQLITGRDREGGDGGMEEGGPEKRGGREREGGRAGRERRGREGERGRREREEREGRESGWTCTRRGRQVDLI